ncbi:rod shape-determining protein RodA [Candidatus Deianiraea vastatrix]|uniref:Rod shape-determining protein RodA n=1 Tax=Candidatus Deianiraea vastatrix TaxID=2163644 RepID=A0A5B8XF10_9RICK|nr:rod shape-determining protein RodA [Candidatus Deianiraea vastatrix]QED23898.1 Rod shape-determining protein RodA [Candidatus Deianiraea vastatrix]
MLSAAQKKQQKRQMLMTSSYIATKIFDFQKLKKMPFSFVILMAMMLAIGLTAIFSVDQSGILFKKQLFSLPFMMCIFALVTCIHPVYLKRYSYIFYLLCLFLLVLTYAIGKISLGAQRWLSIGVIQIQPSEFIKIGIILVMAQYFSKSEMRDIASLKKIIKPLLLALVPCVLTIIQPDLGTGMIILFISIVIFFISGVKMWKFALSGVIVLISIPIIWAKLHDYQKQRILTFINPESDVLNSGYNITQAKIAIGGGGFFGSGVGLGSQTRSNFVPENKTDFIFTVIGEEMGFIGTVGLIIMYIGIFFYGHYTSISRKDFFLKIAAQASTTLIFVHMIINIGMNIGIVPVVGVPLPFISYGRSSMLTSFILLGIISNAYVNEDVNLS